ncbi:hypothetical protein KAFR_0C04800 [Kazachstania africana CBS 2517]|uniref:Mso1 N-terminal domain-containing protein n=1 Tax=Kazachstania africana (strain ATCC 22294 / BCRC 22015 / CBS 2517 / CECT 1963 / NBRC 1671 / NRRL Y-8276) TaxID=1071382 RepID=H2ASX1_KAZAF|nr:hypothetical protein KAFR_0C04800 [Kazachstania africana CBS 2517]CCF57471.1 hypothetical protein KAFR_0C04800 [Kazachstania africana CBS 2517]
MSTLASNQSSGNIWSKFRTSTKSLSSSFANLSLKTETDGDSPTSTVVHKALVKYYKHQEPFTGFPGWLGHKEDLPSEQKILQKQNEHIAKQNRPSKFANIRRAATDIKAHHLSSSSQEPDLVHHRTTAGREMHNIYNKDSSSSYTDDFSSREFTSTAAPLRSSSSRGPRVARPMWTDSTPASHMPSGANESSNRETTPTSSQLMTARLQQRRTQF